MPIIDKSQNGLLYVRLCRDESDKMSPAVRLFFEKTSIRREKCLEFETFYFCNNDDANRCCQRLIKYRSNQGRSKIRREAEYFGSGGGI